MEAMFPEPPELQEMQRLGLLTQDEAAAIEGYVKKGPPNWLTVPWELLDKVRSARALMAFSPPDASMH